MLSVTQARLAADTYDLPNASRACEDGVLAEVTRDGGSGGAVVAGYRLAGDSNE